MKGTQDKERSLGAEIIAGLEQALAYERGTLTNVKVTRASLAEQRAEVTAAPACHPARIASIRERLHLSQPVFAAALNVSAETVKKWEQGTREPDGAALRLLELADMHPEWIVERIASAPTSKAIRKRPVRAPKRRR